VSITRIATSYLAGLAVLSSSVWASGKAAPVADGTAETREIVLRVARRQVRDLADGEYPRGTWEQAQAAAAPKGVNWTYQWGVTLYGLLRASAATSEQPIEDFVLKHNQIVSRFFSYQRWIQATFGATQKEGVDKLVQASPLRRFLLLDRLDFCGAMGHQLLESLLRHGAKPEPEQTEALEYVGDYIATKQARLPDGVFWRPEAKETLWIDDLYMSCPFLVRWSEYKRQRGFADDAARQVLGMAKRQQDKDGLWFHAAFVSQNKTSPYKWGRANGWAMVTTVEVLQALPADHPDRAALLDVLRKHVAAIKPLQAASGLWHQVLDHPELWEETSCSAMFAYSIARAVRRGWLPKEDLEIAKRAFAGVRKNISPAGEVLEVCEGTGIGETLEFYATRRRPIDDHHGPGPVMLAGAELLEIAANATKKK